MMPKAKIDICSSAPPENMLNIPRNDPEAWLMILLITARSTPGVVTKTPIRYTASSARVNSSRRRSSGILRMLEKPKAMARRRLSFDQLDRATELLDFFFGRGGELVGLDLQLLAELTIGQHLDPRDLA